MVACGKEIYQVFEFANRHVQQEYCGDDVIGVYHAGTCGHEQIQRGR